MKLSMKQVTAMARGETLTITPPRAKESKADVENRLVGEWIIGEQQSGALTIDIRRLNDVLSGIRLALGS